MTTELVTEHVEQVRSRKRPGSVRYWRDAARTELHSATCRVCGELKAAEELARNALCLGGRDNQCINCKRAADRVYANERYATDPARRATIAASMRRTLARYRARTPEQVAADRARLRPSGYKTCRSCATPRPLVEFPADVASPDGLNHSCRSCNARACTRRRDAHLADLLAELDDARDLTGCWYTGYAFTPDDDMELEHVIPKAAFEPGDNDMDDPLNIRPALASVNRGPGGKHEKAPLDYIEELYPGILDLLGSWPCEVVELRPREEVTA